MNYRQLANMDVSEIVLDGATAENLSRKDFEAVVSKALDLGINFFCTLRPEETRAIGEAVNSLSARRNTIITAGIPNFFAAFTRHKMRLAPFLEHELVDRLQRLSSNYLDCFVIDLGHGRSVDLESVRNEKLSDGGNGKTLTLETFEGGTFLHETIRDCLDIIERLKQEGRVRMAGISGENIEVLERVLVKHEGFDAAFVPYNYGFRAAGDELIPVASMVNTKIVATKPLWWNVRKIPITVLATCPYPPDKAAVGVSREVLSRTACKWPLSESAVAGVVVEAEAPEELVNFAQASGDMIWTRADEEALRPVAEIARTQDALLVMLSAMNSAQAQLRARGWAALQKKTGVDFDFDPDGPETQRADALARIASGLVTKEVSLPAEDLDELL